MTKKYKVWDIRNNKWDTENTFYISSDGILKIVWVFEEPIDCRDFYEVFFSTGLTDKNGVEIYEGDIIKLGCISHKDFKDGFIGVVEYDDEYATFCVDIENIEKRVAHNTCAGMHTCVADKRHKVIGHIKTNPELLKNNE